MVVAPSESTPEEKALPEEVESVLRYDPQIRDVLVMGTPDERWGHRVAALIGINAYEGFCVESMLAAPRQQPAGYTLPKAVFLAPELKRSPAGKPD